MFNIQKGFYMPPLPNEKQVDCLQGEPGDSTGTSPLAKETYFLENTHWLPRLLRPLSVAAPLTERNVTKEQSSISPKVLHARIRQFKGTAEELEKLLEGAPEELKNSFFYSSCCYHIVKDTAFFKVVYKIFKEGIYNNKVNDVGYHHFIDLAGKSGHFKEADWVYQHALQTGCVDRKINNAYMNVAGMTGHGEKVLESYNLACEKNLLDAFTGNTFIKMAGKYDKFELAKVVFDWMLAMPGFADAITFSTYIKTMGKLGHFEECERALDIARDRSKENKKMLNSYVFNHCIQAAGKHNKFKRAAEIFREAKKRKLDDLNVRDAYQAVQEKQNDLLSRRPKRNT